MKWSLFPTHTVCRIALLEAQNRQLQDAVQTLYEYVRTSHNLPALPARSPGDDRPLLHDIVAYANTLPMGMIDRPEQVQHQIGKPNTTPTVSSSRSQLETSPFQPFAATVPYLSTFIPSSTQQDLPLTEYGPAHMSYERLESGLDLQELWSFIDIDPAEAASLYHWL